MSEVRDLAVRAKEASRALAKTSSTQRNRALLAMAHALMASSEEILAANAEDMEAAKAKHTAAPLLDRLALDPQRLKSISEAVKSLALLPDPIGEVVSGSRMPNGIWLQQVRVPLGVVAMIYEARPNVTADAAALCDQDRQRGHPARRLDGGRVVRGDRARARARGDGCRAAGELHPDHRVDRP